METVSDAADLWRLTVENSPIAMALVGVDGRLLTVNQAFCSLLGYPADQLSRLGFQELTHPGDLDADLDLFGEVLDGRRDSYRLRKRYLASDGAIVWGDLSVAVVRGPDGTPRHFISQILDVSEQRAYQELQDEFVSSVSHELRTPLASVMGYLELLGDREDLAPDVIDQLRVIQRNAERLRALLTDLLHIGQASRGALQLDLRAIDLVTVVHEAVAAALPQAAAAGIEVTIEAPDVVVVDLDERRMRQVLDNLLSNAVKYSDAGDRVRVVVAVTESSTRTDTRIEVEIADTGVGIGATEIPKVFDRFFRGAGALDRRVPGTGLGLTIAKSIVEAHGGRIALASERGRGTSVRVALPAAP